VSSAPSVGGLRVFRSGMRRVHRAHASTARDVRRSASQQKLGGSCWPSRSPKRLSRPFGVSPTPFHFYNSGTNTLEVRGGKAPAAAPLPVPELGSTSLQEGMEGMEARLSAHLTDVNAHFNAQMSEQKSRLSALEAGLTRLEATQLELKALLLGLSSRPLGPSAAASAAASTTTSAASSPAAALGNLRIGDEPLGMSAPSPAQSSNASENAGKFSFTSLTRLSFLILFSRTC
jgi:hypothetical protein